MHWRTLQKILTHSEPPGYRQTQPRPQPKIGPYRERLQQILTAGSRPVPASSSTRPNVCGSGCGKLATQAATLR